MGLFTQEEMNDIQRSLEIMTDWFNNKMTNPDNRAPKNIKGDYDLSIHGNKIVLADNIDGTTVEARCHPHDNFDIGEGMKEAFKKLNEKREEMNKRIEVGDWVEIADKEQQYCFYWEWLPNDKFSMVKNFAYGEKPYDKFFKVMYIGKHKELDKDLAFIQGTNGKCYTFNLSGLKKVVKP